MQFQTNTVAILQSLTERNILWVLRGCAGAQSSLQLWGAASRLLPGEAQGLAAGMGGGDG